MPLLEEIYKQKTYTDSNELTIFFYICNYLYARLITYVIKTHAENMFNIQIISVFIAPQTLKIVIKRKLRVLKRVYS